MKIYDVPQGTPQWHAARCGKITASRIADVMRKTKTGVSASRATYAGELVAQRLSRPSRRGVHIGRDAMG